MGAKNKYEKILARKKVLLADAPGQTPKSLLYQHALELIRSQRRAGKYEIGNYYLMQVVDQVTEVPEPAVYLLNVYIDEMCLEDAQRLAAVLRTKFPIDSSALRARARFHQFAGDLPAAEAVMLQAVQIHPNNSKNLEMLAELYQSIGASASALDYYNRALRIEPSLCAALFGKARLLGAKATPDFIEQIRSAIESNQFTGIQLAFLHFAMAFIYEDADVDLHFAHLDAGNRTVAARRNFDIAARRKATENILYRFRQPVIDALQGLTTADFKPIFVVGMPRSGTTLIEQIIGAHPQCQPIGESAAFSRAIADADKLGCPPLDTSSPQAIEACRQYFLRLADNFKSNRLVVAAAGKNPVDKSIGNYMLLGLMFLTMPNARAIYVERHPLAIAYSCYQQYFSSGNTFSYNLEWIAEYYKLFKMLMTHWSTLFPEKILTVRYEDLVRDKQCEVEKILKFCDLEWDSACFDHQNTVGLVVTASDSQVRQPVYQSSVERWRKVERHLNPAKRLLGEWLDYPQ